MPLIEFHTEYCDYDRTLALCVTLKGKRQGVNLSCDVPPDMNADRLRALADWIDQQTGRPSKTPPLLV